MAGLFELFVDAQAQFRFRLLDASGTIVAVSSGFEDKCAAVAGIEAVREYAGMGLVTDASQQAPDKTRKPDSPGIHLPTITYRRRIQDTLAS